MILYGKYGCAPIELGRGSVRKRIVVAIKGEAADKARVRRGNVAGQVSAASRCGLEGRGSGSG